MKVTSIAPWYSFTDALAHSLLQHELAEATILLPNRRACRALKDALIRYSDGKAMILPRMMPFADLDANDLYVSPQWVNEQLKPPISTLERHGILMQLILRYGQVSGEKGYGQASHAGQLARELARLIDQIHWEGLPFEALHDLVPDEYAQHWQITLDFLKIITQHWPKILESRGVSDPAAWRRDLILAYADRWAQDPPDSPVIAAGSTGSIPCTARLIQVVHGLPKGRVVLPGLDFYLSEDEWQNLEISHPQYGLARLLETLQVSREEVQQELEDDYCVQQARAQVLSRAMQPLVQEQWSVNETIARQALIDFQMIECRNPMEEASVIALQLRHAIETPKQTAALVTSDRQLAQRVRTELKRWQLNPDDTAGTPLSQTSEGTFLILLAHAMVAHDSILSLLNLLQHPLTKFDKDVLEFDKTFCRTHRRLSDMPDNDLLDAYSQAVLPFQMLRQQGTVPLSAIMEAHMQAARALAVDEFLQSEEGQQLVEFWRQLHLAKQDYPELSLRDYPAFLQQLMQAETLRQPFGYHPRLFILGPLEARSFKTDVMILGGLNEGTWPALTEVDPWLNRPMRAEYGLPLPERKIGLSAHDFAQAFSARQVVCTRSLRINGTPTVPSRWLLRLEAVLKASGQELKTSEGPWLSWAHMLDQPEKIQACHRPAPCPPVSARPNKLSVTQVEIWMRDPYALYARHVLKLEPLDELEMPLSVAEKGTMIHQILEAFVASGATDYQDLLEEAKKVFKDYHEQPEVISFWWPRFKRIAAWFVEIEKERSVDIASSYPEASGRLVLQTSAGPFTLKAKADRLDLCHDGSVEIIDYKTGTIPTKREVEQGYSPQLSLEAAMVAQGAFPQLGARSVRGVHYWRLRGNDPAGEVRSFSAIDDLGDAALSGLRSLVETYADPSVPYLAQPRSRVFLAYNPYAHLTRTQEWMREEAA